MQPVRLGHVDETVSRFVKDRCDHLPAFALRRFSPSNPPSDDTSGVSLEDVTVFDAVQSLAQGQRTGRLELVGPAGTAYIWFSDGQICDAYLTELLVDDTPEKALLRALMWKTGVWSFSSSNLPNKEVIAIRRTSLNEWLMTAVKDSDEVFNILSKLPSDARITESVSIDKPQVQTEQQFIQFAVNAASVQTLLDTWPETDRHTLYRLEQAVERDELSILGANPKAFGSAQAPKTNINIEQAFELFDMDSIRKTENNAR